MSKVGIILCLYRLIILYMCVSESVKIYLFIYLFIYLVYFLHISFNIIVFAVLYFILKLRPVQLQTHNLLIIERSGAVPEIFEEENNRNILKLTFFEKIGPFKSYKSKIL